MKHFTFRKYLLLLCMFLPLYFPMTYAETDQIVHGYVLDANGLPLEGIRVMMYRSLGQEKISTITDANGAFSLEFNYTSFKLSLVNALNHTFESHFFPYLKYINNYDGSPLILQLVPATTLFF